MASAIAVWPETLEFNQQQEQITVFNNLQNNSYYHLTLKHIKSSEDDFWLKPNEQKRIMLQLKSENAEVSIEEYYDENQNVINSLKLPLKINYEVKSKNRYYLLAIIPIILILIFIAIKKKYLNKNKIY